MNLTTTNSYFLCSLIMNSKHLVFTIFVYMNMYMNGCPFLEMTSIYPSIVTDK